MALPVSLIKAFWDFDKKMDAARLAKQTYPDTLTEVLDIPYVDDGEKYHKLDVYYPRDMKQGQKLPVIIDIHGGGWFYGDKELNKNYCLHLAERGFVVFGISYRLVPDVLVADQLRDCMLALKYIAKHLSDYPCNKSRIYLTGDSAGGQLAGYVAAATVSKRVREVFDLVDPKLHISAVSLVSPCPYLEPAGLMKPYMIHVVGKKWKKQPYARYLDFDRVVKSTKGKYPPTIIFTSFMDVIAKGQSRNAYKALRANGTKVKFDTKFKPSLNHVYQVLEPDIPDSVKAIDKMVAFFGKNK